MINSGMALSAYFGDQVPGARDMASGLIGAGGERPGAGCRCFPGIPGDGRQRTQRVERFVSSLQGACMKR